MSSYIQQNTIQQNVSCKSVGVHSGEIVTLTMKPAPENSGIVFVRSDIADKNNKIPARWDMVADTRLCTVLSNEDGVSISTVEHILSAIWASDIDNAIIEVDGSEMPIMDGSSAPFIDLAKKAGIQKQSAPRKFLLIKSSVSIKENDREVELRPAASQSFHCTVDFDSSAIGRQSCDFSFSSDTYDENISKARTFGFLHEVEALRSMGLAKGGSLDNAVVIDGENILNPEGLRYNTEFARHKLLDAVGDIFLGGGQIIGHYRGIKSGHHMNNEILRKLFATKDAWEFTTLTTQQYRAMRSSDLMINEQKKSETFFVIRGNSPKQTISY